MDKKSIYIIMPNLQLFAGQLNTNVTTDSGLSVENKTFYDMALIETAKPQLVHDQFGQKRPIPKNGGKEIEFRQYASLPKALTPLTEGVTPDGKKLSVTAIKAEVSQYGDFVALSDVLDLTAIDNNVLEATKAIGLQAGLTLDTITRNVLQSGTNVFYCPPVDDDGKVTGEQPTSRSALTANCKLTVKVVKRIATLLKAANAPKIDGSYVCICHPYAVYDLTNDPKWEEWHKYCTPENMYDGEIGRISGVRFVETSEAAIFTGAGCPSGLAVYGSLFLAANAYGVTEITGGGLQTIVKQLGSAGTGDPLNQRSTVGWKAMKTAEILLQPYMIRVESCGEFSADAEAN